jgi:type I restriction enzyme, S subunit
VEVKAGYKQTEVGVIPKEWDAPQIRGVCTLINGRGFKPHEWDTVGLPIIRIQNLNGSEDFNFYSGQYNPKILVEHGQLLFAWSGSRGTSFGPHVWNGDRALLNYHTWKVVVNETKATPEFLLYALRQLTSFIEDRAHGASALVHTQKWEMEKFHVPIPARLLEQQVIATVLNDADALLDGLDRLIAKKRDLKKAAMQQLLTGQTRLPGFHGEWEVRSLHDVCLKIQDGTHFSPKLGGNDFLYVTSKNIRFGTLDMSTAERISAAEHAKIYARCDVKKGDLLLTKDGANTGNAALNTLEEPFSLLSSVALLRFDSRRHSAAYFLQQLLSNFGQQQIKELMSGNAITRLTLVKIRALRFAIASFEEQKAIAEVLTDMDAELAALERGREKTRALRQAMMQELLTGKTRLI